MFSSRSPTTCTFLATAFISSWQAAPLLSTNMKQPQEVRRWLHEQVVKLQLHQHQSSEQWDETLVFVQEQRESVNTTFIWSSLQKCKVKIIENIKLKASVEHFLLLENQSCQNVFITRKKFRHETRLNDGSQFAILTIKCCKTLPKFAKFCKLCCFNSVQLFNPPSNTSADNNNQALISNNNTVLCYQVIELGRQSSLREH